MRKLILNNLKSIIPNISYEKIDKHQLKLLILDGITFRYELIDYKLEQMH